MDKFSVDIVPVDDIQGKYPYIRKEFEKNLDNLSSKSRTVLECQGSHRLIEALNRCLEGCKIVAFGRVYHDSHAISTRSVVWKDIEQLERNNIVVKLCFIKPTEVKNEISLSDDDDTMVGNLRDKSNLEFVLLHYTHFHLSLARFKIFDSVKKKVPHFKRLWLVDHLNGEGGKKIFQAQFEKIADKILLEELTSWNVKTGIFLDEIQNRGQVENIVYKVVGETCDRQNIIQISRSIDLRNYRDHEHVGNAYSGSYSTRRSWLVKDLKEQLIVKILKNLSESIAQKFKERFNKFMSGLVDVPSSMISETMALVKKILPDDVIIHEIDITIMILFKMIKDLIVDIVMVVYTVVRPVNINSAEWRDEIAKDIDNAVDKIRTQLTEKVINAVMSQLADLNNEVRPKATAFLETMKSVVDKKIYECQTEQSYTEEDYESEKSLRNACKDLSTRMHEEVSIYPGTRDGDEIIVSLVSKLDLEVPTYHEFDSKKYPLVVKRFGDSSEEVQRIDAYENENEVPVDKELRKKATKLINERGRTLIQQHSNLTSISVSDVKSKNAGKLISEKTCIVFYCSYKGIIPLAENKFPTDLDEIPVDVREGFVLLAVGCREFCDPLNIGCSIGLKGRDKCGSLGLFVQEKMNKNNHGFITCCHVFHDLSHSVDGHRNYSGNKKAVLQPAEPDIQFLNQNQSSSNDVEMVDEPANREGITDCPQNTEVLYSLSRMPNLETNDKYVCGYLMDTFLGNIPVGSGIDTGVDVAYVQILSRDPQKAVFPNIVDNSKESFRKEELKKGNPIAEKYKGLLKDFWKEELEISNAIEEICDDEDDKFVYKFGITTDLTIGKFKRTVTTLCMPVGKYGRMVFENQYEIFPFGNTPFLELGDSGAAVFKKRGNMLHCIGLCIGKSDNGGSRCFMTPINAVLTALSPKFGSPELEVRKFMYTEEPMEH